MNYRQQHRIRASHKVLQFIILLFGGILLAQLYKLQIIDYELYSPLSKKNSLRQMDVQPARGLVFDINGELLVDNEPIYTITITPANFDKKKIPLLSKLLGITKDELKERIIKAQKFSWHRSSKLYPEVDFTIFSAIQEHIWELQGIGHQIESKRHYPNSSVKASHVLGYLREISEKQYQSFDRYRLGDKAGTIGLEWFYENQLRGNIGVSYVRINALGQELGPYSEGSLDISPTEGADLYLTLDSRLQALAEDLMVNKTGGIVALDPRNGEIRALVSSPIFDLSKLAGKLDNEYWYEINADSTTPLYNRAVSALQPPGSTFKPLMGLIGLKLGVITPETTVICKGFYKKGREYKCTGVHGKMVLESAIQKSCNTYFFWLMNRIGVENKLDHWSKLAKDFGLGGKNNIDLPNEVSGIIPDSLYFDRTFGKNKWGIGDVINLGVGQGVVSVSPLQMAAMVSIIANGGFYVQPHLVRSIAFPGDSVIKTNPVRKKIDWVDDDNLNLIKSGMRKVVTGGSARWYANLKNIEVAGKTGTSQNPHGLDHAWFIAYAPAKDPELAIAVLVENAGFGSTSASPIASLLIEYYFTGKYRNWVYERMKNFVPKVEEKEDNTE